MSGSLKIEVVSRGEIQWLRTGIELERRLMFSLFKIEVEFPWLVLLISSAKTQLGVGDSEIEVAFLTKILESVHEKRRRRARSSNAIYSAVHGG